MAVHHKSISEPYPGPQGQRSRNMLIIKPGVLALLFTTCACASTAGCIGSQRSSKEPITDIVSEFRLIRYNGRELEGRILVRGAHGSDRLVIHEDLAIF